jgi:alkanesulfonate monooxygenase SsuD/methylene tetrahydromethanopterin reductase-like flavin-dependent oxidoreductase (luciferase family)
MARGSADSRDLVGRNAHADPGAAGEQPERAGVGGDGAPALRRAGRLGDAWHAIGIAPERVREQYEQVLQHAKDAGRDPDSVGLTIRTRPPLKDPPQAVDLLRKYREVGVSHAVLEIATGDMERARSMMEVLARDVRPQVIA